MRRWIFTALLLQIFSDISAFHQVLDRSTPIVHSRNGDKIP
jgi:hypothetical protein